ncbi:MAG: hypothetical protein ACI4VF_06530 [Lachnospirales bacterium]
MKNKDDIIKHIKQIIKDNNISIYSIANIAKINRSTLQKSLSGDRNLNLRQFDALINVLPITNAERKSLYRRYVAQYWSDEQITCTETIIDILNTIETNIDKKEYVPFNSYSSTRVDFNNISGRQNIIEAVRSTTFNYISSNKATEICSYIPFNNDFFTSSVGYCLDKNSNNISVSVLFEFLKPNGNNHNENPLILKNILPLLINNSDICTFNYIYVDSYFYDNHLTPYPYYIVYPKLLLLFNENLDSVISVTNEHIISSMYKTHKFKVENANPLNVMKLDIDGCVEHLMENQVANDMYAIAFEPCISSFVSPNMYAELITDDFPNKTAYLDLIKTRIQAITETPKKFTLFNKESIDRFARNGNLLIFNHPYLKPCNISQRIEILSNILNTMNDSTVTMRAYNSKDLNVSEKFEITNVQNLYNFDILIYEDEKSVKLIDIHEPIISNYFIKFIHNIIDTPLVYTFEETKEHISNAIEGLKTQL